MVLTSSTTGKLVSTLPCTGITWFHILCSRTLDLQLFPHGHYTVPHHLHQEQWVSFLIPIFSALGKQDTIFSYTRSIRFPHLHHWWDLCQRQRQTNLNLEGMSLILAELWMQWLHNIVLSRWPNEMHWTIRVSLEEISRMFALLHWFPALSCPGA